MRVRPSEGEALEELVSAYQGVQADIHRLARVYPREVLWQLMAASAISADDLSSESSAERFAQSLSERLLTLQDKTVHYDVFVRQDPERACFTLWCVERHIVWQQIRFWAGVFRLA